MFEKVNPCHPDKVADRIAGAIVDFAYEIQENPRIAVEVLIGHDKCFIIIESTVQWNDDYRRHIESLVTIISDVENVEVVYVEQDEILSKAQETEIRCGDNGIFKGSYISKEEQLLTNIAGTIFNSFPFDGKYVYTMDNDCLTVCQSHADNDDLNNIVDFYNIKKRIINPLGFWTGGVNVDSGATNRKLGSDMGRGVTGGGLHGKDLSKADVSINIFAHLLAQQYAQDVEISCSIGDTFVNATIGKQKMTFKYSDIVKEAKKYIISIGGFEQFATWGLIRPQHSPIEYYPTNLVGQC